MTLDETINNFAEATKNHRYEQQYWLNERDETSPLYEADRFSLADDSRESAEYYEQLAEWLTDYKELKNSIGAVKLSDMKEALELIREYKAENIAQKKLIAEYKRLLKAAVRQMAEVGGVCDCIHSQNCPLDECGRFTFHDEIMKFINN